jgi:hypothetical protein
LRTVRGKALATARALEVGKAGHEQKSLAEHAGRGRLRTNRVVA